MPDIKHSNSRICLFAGHNPTNTIEKYVVYLLTAVSKHADIYYLSDDTVPECEYTEILPFTKKAWSYRHGKYDFGSWQEIIHNIGWDEIKKYNHVILMNDSNYGPLLDMDKIFDDMDRQNVDVWGITANHGHHWHLQSYFLYLNIKNEKLYNIFYHFIENIERQNNKQDICLLYEIEFSKLMIKNNFSIKPYINCQLTHVPHNADITRFQNTLLDIGSPFIKRKVFADPYFALETIFCTYKKINFFNYPSHIFIKKQFFFVIINILCIFLNIKMVLKRIMLMICIVLNIKNDIYYNSNIIDD